MTDTFWILIITSVGGLLELAGLALVVREIRANREHGRGLFREHAVARPSTVATRMEIPTPSVPEDHEESPDDPSAPPGDSYELKLRLLGELTPATRADLQRVIAEEAEKLSRQDRERDLALRRFLHTLTTGSLKDRVVGVILIAAGIVCTTGAGIWSTVIC